MLDHAGEALMVFVASWKFLLRPSYRRRKLQEWQAARATLSGKLVIAGEILLATVVGMVVPLWLIATVFANW
ncbi:MAG: hypothetical protein ACREOO_20420 [bacterium]